MITPLAAIVDGYKRRRHSLGFGVHSPLAYRVVRECVMARGSYYAYPELDAMLETVRGHIGRRKRRVRMTHRMAARFPRRKVCMGGDMEPALAAAVALALPKARITDVCVDATFALWQGSDCPYTPAADSVLVLFSVGADCVKRVWSEMDCGIMLYSPDSAMVVADRGVSKVRYTVDL